MNNIFEMLSFDFLEFATSTAGILIIVGIICLIIGICIFLKEGKKAAKPATEVKEEAAPVETQVAAEAPVQPEVAPVEEPAVAPVVENAAEATPIVVNSTPDGVAEVPVPEVNETLNISEPAPAVESLDTPVVEAPAVETPAVESLDDAQPTVYGGESPAVEPVVVAEEQPKEIYGGANPLENTAPIPTVAEPSAEVTPAVEPVVEAAPEVVAPIAEAPVAEAPEVVTPVAPAAPEETKEEIEKLEF